MAGKQPCRVTQASSPVHFRKAAREIQSSAFNSKSKSGLAQSGVRSEGIASGKLMNTKNGHFFTFLCASVAGVFALALVAQSFARPAVFQSLLFGQWILSRDLAIS